MTALPEELLPLALSRPHDAIAAAQALLAASPDAATASIAHQATGIGLRQLGEVDAAIQRHSAPRPAETPNARTAAAGGRMKVWRKSQTVSRYGTLSARNSRM